MANTHTHTQTRTDTPCTFMLHSNTYCFHVSIAINYCFSLTTLRPGRNVIKFLAAQREKATIEAKLDIESFELNWYWSVTWWFIGNLSWNLLYFILSVDRLIACVCYCTNSNGTHQLRTMQPINIIWSTWSYCYFMIMRNTNMAQTEELWNAKTHFVRMSKMFAPNWSWLNNHKL